MRAVRIIEHIPNRRNMLWIAMQPQWILDLWGWVFNNRKQFMIAYEKELIEECRIKYGKMYFQIWISRNIKHPLERNQ